MRIVNARIAQTGDVLFLVPDSIRSLSTVLGIEGFQQGMDVFIVDGEVETETSTAYVNEIRALLDGGGEPAEIIAAIEAWWDSKP